MANVLTSDHVKKVCNPGQGAKTCSFLIGGAGGLECAKGTMWQAQIAERRAAKTMDARGDNCSGPPNFKPC